MDLPNVPSAPDFSSLGLPDLKPTQGVECSFTKLFESLEPGLHLAVNGYLNADWHHGIYVGKERDEHVIVDMWGRDKPSARIQKRSLDDFLKGAVRICIVQYNSADLVELRAAAVVRALMAILPGAAPPLYDIFANDCECFAFWCCTGWYSIPPDAELFAEVPPYEPGFKN